MNKELATLEKLLASHDWYHQYCDDYSAYKRGEDEWYRINVEQRRLINENLVSSEEIQALTSKYRPIR